MAYTEDGQYYFQPEIDGEDAEALQQVERLEHASNYKRMKNAQAYEANMSKELMEEALKEAGITQAEYQQLFYEDPQASKELLAQGMKHVTKTLAAKKGKRTQPRETKKEQPQPEEASKAEAIERATKKVNSGSNLTQEEELDLIGAIVGRL